MGPAFPSKLELHADICAGQKKNRYSTWFRSCLVCGGYFDEVELGFLVPGHTKNECDGAFGSVKKLLRRLDVLCPGDMRQLINKSAHSTTCICATKVS